MIRKLAAALLVGSLAGCVPATSDQTPNATDASRPVVPADPSRIAVETATVDGRAYDVVYDRYAPERASIYGVRTGFDGFTPRAEIIERATGCLLGGMTVISANGLEHPSRSDLDLFESVTMDCSEA